VVVTLRNRAASAGVRGFVEARQQRVLVSLFTSVVLCFSVSSCTDSRESSFEDFVQKTPVEQGSINLNEFVEWDEAVVRCTAGGTSNEEPAGRDFGSLVIYRDGELILNYESIGDVRIVFCPNTRSQEFILQYPNGTMLLERTEPVFVPFVGEVYATYLSPQMDQ
jgi:hypothetical protein